MPIFRYAACGVALFVLSFQTASALTADDVWADWQRLAAGGNTALTATATRDGDRLVLTDVSFAFTTLPDPDRMQIARIELQDRPDGTVAVLLPARFPVTFSTPKGGVRDPRVVTLVASAPDFSLIIADIGDKAAFEVTAPSLALSLDQIVPAMQIDEKVAINLAVADLSVRHRMDLTQPTQTVALTASIGTAHIDVMFDVPDPEMPKSDMSFDLAALSVVVDAVVPASVRERVAGAAPTSNPLPEIVQGLADGLTMKGEVTFGSIAVKADIADRVDQFQFDIASAAGGALAKFDPESLAYDIALGETAVQLKGAPPGESFMDITMGISQFAYGISVGIGDLVTPQKARFNFRLVDLTLPPEVWIQVDPTGTFGASPMTFVLDVAGRYALAPEMLTPDWKPAPGAFPPMDIIDATLSELVVKGFGADLGGKGSLTFDEADLVTFDGVPAPTGTLSFQATGINALIDRAVAAGLIPQSELTGLRLGLAMIAKAAPEPDTLQSEVEFRDKGIYLNGQQLR